MIGRDRVAAFWGGEGALPWHDSCDAEAKRAHAPTCVGFSSKFFSGNQGSKNLSAGITCRPDKAAVLACSCPTIANGAEGIKGKCRSAIQNSKRGIIACSDDIMPECKRVWRMRTGIFPSTQAR
jgi:hypothetical protein